GRLPLVPDALPDIHPGPPPGRLTRTASTAPTVAGNNRMQAAVFTEAPCDARGRGPLSRTTACGPGRSRRARATPRPAWAVWGAVRQSDDDRNAAFQPCIHRR